VQSFRSLTFVLLSAFVQATFHTPAQASSSGKPRKDESPSSVLLISIDGFRADYLSADRVPHLWKLGQEGVRAKGLQPVFPSLTFPNHYSIVTGLYAEHHGIVSNDMLDPQIPGKRFRLGDSAVMDDPRWWQGGEPIWTTAEKQGVVSATMFWPGSSVEIRGKRPRYWKPYDQTMTNDARVDQVLAWLDLPQVDRPRLITLYFDEVDTMGHMAGPLSPEVLAALSRVDSAIGRVLKGLAERRLQESFNVIVVSDHGMSRVEPDKAIALDRFLDPKDIELVGQGAMASLYPAPGKLEAVYAKLHKADPRLRVFRKAEVPERFHYRDHARIGPLVLLAEPGAYVTVTARAPRPGTHGYDNALPEMFGLFIGSGPRFKQGLTVEPFLNIHVYPLMARILDLNSAPVDGDPKVSSAWLRQ